MNKEPLLKHYIFLLGGHDLEMQEIKNILAEKKLTYHDHNLKWGARLSSYSSIFYKKQHRKKKLNLKLKLVRKKNHDYKRLNEKSF